MKLFATPSSLRRPNPSSAGVLWLVLYMLSMTTARAGAQAAVGESITGEATGEGYGASAVVDKPIAATNGEDATASGTEVSLKNRVRALETVSDALQSVPGTRLRNIGGFGSFSGISLRGAELAQTSVLLGNMPLSSVDQGAFDFSLLPLPLFGSLVVYRGGAPAWLSDGAIGGLVQLKPRRENERLVRASAGYGSFARYRLSAETSLASEREDSVNLLTHVSLDGAQNNFSYRDTGNTELITSDDRTARVRNADVTQGTGLGHLTVPIGPGQLEAVVLGLARHAGIPGPQNRQSPDARRKLYQLQGMVGYTAGGADHGQGQNRNTGKRLQVLLGASHQANQVTDLKAQIGTTYPARTDDRWTQLFARAAGTLPLTDWLDSTVTTSARLDLYRPENPEAFSAPPRPSQRSSLSITAETRAHGKPMAMPSELRMSVLLQRFQGDIESIRLGTGAGQNVRAVVTNFRAAAAVSPAHFLTISSSLSNGQRMPSIRELFGDRAFLLQNTQLSPERALTADLGLTLAGTWGDFSLRSELRAFMLRVHNLIAYVRTSQNTARAENLGYGNIYGAEAGLEVDYNQKVTWSTSATALHSKSPSGHALPYRPPLVLHSQLATHIPLGPAVKRLSLFTDLEVISYNYTDSKGVSLIPGRYFVGLGASLTLARHVSAQLRATNILDHPSKDLNGFWLPGRTLFISLTLEEPI